ncbi:MULTISPECIES: hypothetical protein [unclassified Paraburkholderia]|uniref:hypothetical protein n=1 Tax=unclassified Paraburkholderia TaxID=2615204 RepID=UPI002AB0417F|nr:MULTISPECIES: hypothetical protein [unclassified Paraburkholderia]
MFAVSCCEYDGFPYGHARFRGDSTGFPGNPAQSSDELKYERSHAEDNFFVRVSLKKHVSLTRFLRCAGTIRFAVFLRIKPYVLALPGDQTTSRRTNRLFNLRA